MTSHYDDIKRFMQIAGQPTPEVLSIPWEELDEIGVDAVLARHPSRIPLREVLTVEARNLAHVASVFRRRYPNSQIAFRCRLMCEELGEILGAFVQENEAAVARELVDSEYVTLGTAVQFGIPHDAVFAEVNQANMKKFIACSACNGSGTVERAITKEDRAAWLAALVPGDPVAIHWRGGSRTTGRVESIVDGICVAHDKAPHQTVFYGAPLGYHDGSQARLQPPFLVSACEACKGYGLVALLDAQNKVMKPPGWTPPDIAAVLARTRGERGT